MWTLCNMKPNFMKDYLSKKIIIILLSWPILVVTTTESTTQLDQSDIRVDFLIFLDVHENMTPKIVLNSKN